MSTSFVQKTSNTWSIPFDRLSFTTNDLLGVGSFKRVYKGNYLGSTVAVQEIMDVSTNEFATVEKELAIMQSLRHPNVLLFIGVSCLLYTSPSPRDQRGSRMPSSA